MGIMKIIIFKQRSTTWLVIFSLILGVFGMSTLLAMVLKGCTLDKPLAAGVALIRSLARVTTDVKGQIIGLCKALVAICALVGSFAVMNAHVLLQLVGASESFFAHCANVGSFACMSASMALEIGGSWESLIAKVTLKRFLTSVTSYVYNKI